MGFDISKLTSVVNKYLNSISDVSAAARRVSEEAESKALFGKELQVAIKQNIASHMDDGKMSEAVGNLGNFPNIEGQIKSQIDSATSGVKSTFDQINGGLGAMRNAKSLDSTQSTDTAKGGKIDVAVGSNEASLASLLAAYGNDSSLLSGIIGSAGKDSSGLLELLEAAGNGREDSSLAGLPIAAEKGNAVSPNRIGSEGSGMAESLLAGLLGAKGNNDALQAGLLPNAGNTSRGLGSGTMSLEELQDLSRSKFFSNNLLQNDLFSESRDSDRSMSGDDMLSTLTSGISSSQIASSELAAALLKAYKTSGAKETVTSVFGDFSL